MSNHAEVLIMGAGPAGLTASYLLSERRALADVRRQCSSAIPTMVGGISRTVDYKGFLFDIGGHRFFSKSKEVVDLWNEILPDDFIERPRLSRIFYDGKFYSYPLQRLRGAAQPRHRRERAVHAVLRLCQGCCPIENPSTFHDWVRNQFGERLFSIFFKTYTEKVWGMSCDEISADWAAQRIKGLSLGAAVMNALRSLVPPQGRHGSTATVVKTLIETFQYPRKGPGMMWEAAARKIREQGGARPDGPQAGRAALRRGRASSGPSTVPTRRRRGRDLHGATTSSPRRRSANWSTRCQPDADLAVLAPAR